MKIAHFVPIVNKHGYHRNLVGCIYGMSSMTIAHFVTIGLQTCDHMQFLFLIGRFLKNLLLWNCLAIWTEFGRKHLYVWKVSDTGSAHWASSLIMWLYQDGKVTGHVFVCYVMYLCATSCICVLGVSILPLFTIFLLDFGTVPTECYFFSILLQVRLTREQYIKQNICIWQKQNSLLANNSRKIDEVRKKKIILYYLLLSSIYA